LVQTAERREGIITNLVKTAAFVSGSRAMPIAVLSNLFLKRSNDVGLIQGQLIILTLADQR
jgi:Na+(H+)/acetate symporter ActP